MTVVFDAIFIIHCNEVYKTTRNNNNNNVDLGCVISTEPPGNDLKIEGHWKPSTGAQEDKLEVIMNHI